MIVKLVQMIVMQRIMHPDKSLAVHNDQRRLMVSRRLLFGIPVWDAGFRPVQRSSLLR